MKLVSSAIKFYIKDDAYPTIMTGRRHCNILEKMFKLGIIYYKDTAIQGFMTDENTFVDRYEAFQIARRENQLLPAAQEEYKNRAVTPLFSEDVW